MDPITDTLSLHKYLIDVLVAGMLLHDPLIRMRCADAAEKITAIHPEYLAPHKALLLQTLSKVEQPQVRWHVAPMLARLPLSATEPNTAMKRLSRKESCHATNPGTGRRIGKRAARRQISDQKINAVQSPAGNTSA
jgi:hypothetical protein